MMFIVLIQLVEGNRSQSSGAFGCDTEPIAGRHAQEISVSRLASAMNWFLNIQPQRLSPTISSIGSTPVSFYLLFLYLHLSLSLSSIGSISGEPTEKFLNFLLKCYDFCFQLLKE